MGGTGLAIASLLAACEAPPDDYDRLPVAETRQLAEGGLDLMASARAASDTFIAALEYDDDRVGLGVMAIP